MFSLLCGEAEQSCLVLYEKCIHLKREDDIDEYLYLVLCVWNLSLFALFVELFVAWLEHSFGAFTIQSVYAVI